jgi:hypothetical protein
MKTTRVGRASILSFLIGGASLVVMIASIHAAATVLVPVLFAVSWALA